MNERDLGLYIVFKGKSCILCCWLIKTHYLSPIFILRRRNNWAPSEKLLSQQRFSVASCMLSIKYLCLCVSVQMQGEYTRRDLGWVLSLVPALLKLPAGSLPRLRSGLMIYGVMRQWCCRLELRSLWSLTWHSATADVLIVYNPECVKPCYLSTDIHHESQQKSHRVM